MNRVRRTCVLAASAAALSSLAACQKPYTGPQPGQPDDVLSPANNPRVALSTPDLISSLGFDAPIVTRPGDILTVAVPTRSLGSQRYYLDYKYVFYDKDGYELRPPMGWKEVVFEPKEQKRLAANALDARAMEWKLMIKWANR